MRIPELIVDAVVWWPYAAWPAASVGVHDVDEAHMKHMNAELATEDGTRRYLDEFVFGWKDRDDYLALIGTATRARLDDGPTRFMLDPYRHWILPAAEVDALTAEITAWVADTRVRR